MYEMVDYDTGLGVLVKQPAESRVFRMDFSNLLKDTTLSSISSLVATNQGKVAGSSNVTLSGQTAAAEYIEFRIDGGTASENYKITAQVLDSGGGLLEAEGMLYCRDS